MGTVPKKCPKIEVWRSGWIVEHAGAKGEISELWIGDTMLWAVERLDGYVRLDEGNYTVKMEVSPTYGRKQFRVYGHHKFGGKAPILIHSGNHPEDVEGCIAPGTVATYEGVDHSVAAMNKLFALYDGFEVGKQGDLLVTRIT